MHLRPVFIAALIVVCGAGLAWVALAYFDSEAAPPPSYDKNIDREVSRKQMRAIKLGTSRRVVEKKFGRGGRPSERQDFAEPADAECFYYTVLAGLDYLQFCYRDDRLISRREAIDLADDLD